MEEGNKTTLQNALCVGYERLAAWSGLLDRINVFPVADADTGRNLKISLYPLRWRLDDPAASIHGMMRAAVGNSGNIAAAFLAEILKAGTLDALGAAIHRGREKARLAIADPQPGTMLTVLDALARVVPAETGWGPSASDCATVIRCMEKAVADTRDILPVLRQAGVVDAGALGMFICLEAFFTKIAGSSEALRPITDIFSGKLELAADWHAGLGNVGTAAGAGYCVNALIASDACADEARTHLSGCGRSMVLAAEAGHLKLHLHTRDRSAFRDRLAALGRVLAWTEENMVAEKLTSESPCPVPVADVQISAPFNPVHIMTDAAGTLTPADAAALGITLLNSYLIVEDRAWPETLYDPVDLYAAMAEGRKITTAQASLFEREESYASATGRFAHVLYLCVGSAYTGNCRVALAWQARQANADRFTVIDTGAASGRLGIIALSVARMAWAGADVPRVIDFAHKTVARSREFVFLDRLKFLVAGGRISKTRGFFGDLLNLKPVISPAREGAVKVAVVRNRDAQLSFALARLHREVDRKTATPVMLQYSDNRSWVEHTAAARIASLLPAAEILLRPLSLTAGAHMGPGTWSVAFLSTCPEGDV